MDSIQPASSKKNFQTRPTPLQQSGIFLRRVLLSPVPVFVIFFVLMLGLFSMVTMQEGDDLVMAAMHNTYTLPEFLLGNYQSWTGRFFVQILLYLFTGKWFGIWKWLAASSATLTAIMFWHFVTYSAEIGKIKSIYFGLLACLSLGLINYEILIPSVFWISGSLNYLVPFSIALVAFLPFFYAIKAKNPSSSPVTLFFLIPAILTATGQEQISLCFIGFSLSVLVFLFLKKKRLPWVLIIIFLVTIIFEVLSLSAPGNAARFSSEINTWFPAFREIPLLSKVILAVTFIFTTMINQWGFLLMFLWLICGYLVLKRKSILSVRIPAFVSIFYAFLMAIRLIIPATFRDAGILSFADNLFTFHYLARDTFFQAQNFGPYIFWGIGITLIPIMILLLFKKSLNTLVYLVILITAMASIILITFSPTIYASGARTSYVSCMLLILLVLMLLRHEDAWWVLGIPVLLVSIIQLGNLYVSWHQSGFSLTYGILNYREIPFMVIGR